MRLLSQPACSTSKWYCPLRTCHLGVPCRLFSVQRSSYVVLFCAVQEVVKEVLSFANLSDSGGGGGGGARPDSNGHGGAEQEDNPYLSYGDAQGTAAATVQSPQLPHTRPASGQGRRSSGRASGGGAAARSTVLPPSLSYLSYGNGHEGGVGHQMPGRKANSEHGDRIRAFAALMSPNRCVSLEGGGTW